jgi:hypothetical protein
MAASAILATISLIARIASSFDGIDVGRIAVGVDHRDDRDVEDVGLVHGRLLAADVDDEQQLRHAAHVLEAAQALVEALDLGIEDAGFLLGDALKVARGAARLELLEVVDARVDRAPVGQGSAQPAVGHVGHQGALGLAGHRLLGLALGADEQHRAAARDRVAHQAVGFIKGDDRLLEVDDVDPVALREDELLHARVPAPGAMAEVHPGFQQGLHGNDGHGFLSLSDRPLPSAPAGPAVAGRTAQVRERA